MAPERSHSDDLSSYFDRSATAVREYADVFEHQYARPAMKLGGVYHDQHPILSVFLVILFCLSIVPVVTFIGFSIFAAVSFIIIALSVALGAFVLLELIFVSVLLCVLGAVLFMSAFLTGTTISTYLCFRLAVLVRNEGRAGLNEWILEAKSRYYVAAPAQEPLEEDDYAYDDNEPQDVQGGHNSSVESTNEVLTPKDELNSTQDPIKQEY
ncbi:hypothetical protein BDN71DRAFT_1449086 [Pleurotus eryngii]|uniref:Promethin n=1 Tax=Pleurotus eryngii TaxID=5323 RepID=A0A9P5ZXY1_PLEER|nr:hypothetical protein BDN71DRAFT_1449086 [Pleurotus eryngii]